MNASAARTASRASLRLEPPRDVRPDFVVGVWRSTDQDTGTLLVTAKGFVALQRVCQRPLTLHGVLNVPTLETELRAVPSRQGLCRPKKATPFQIVRDDVLAFREDSNR